MTCIRRYSRRSIASADRRSEGVSRVPFAYASSRRNRFARFAPGGRLRAGLSGTSSPSARNSSRLKVRFVPGDRLGEKLRDRSRGFSIAFCRVGRG